MSEDLQGGEQRCAEERSRGERLKDFAYRKTPQKFKNASDLQVRFRTGFIYVTVSVLCILASEWTTLALLSATAAVCAGEFYYMLRADAKLPNEMLGIVAAALYPLSVHFFGLSGALMVSLVLLLALIVWYVFWMRARVPDVGVSFFGAAYTGLLLSGIVVVRGALPAPWGISSVSAVSGRRPRVRLSAQLRASTVSHPRSDPFVPSKLPAVCHSFTDTSAKHSSLSRASGRMGAIT